MRLRLPLLASIAALSLGVLSLSARADSVTLEVQSVTVQAGSSPVNSFLDVFVQVTPDSNGPISLAGFQVEVTLDNSATGSVQFVAPFATTTTEAGHPQLISTNFTPNYGGDNGTNTASATAFTNGANSGVNITNNAGLMEVPFQVLAGAAPGTYNVSIVPFDPTNFDSTTLTENDANADNVPYTVQDGQIIVTSGNLVPLPAAFWPGASLMTLLLAVWGWRRRAA